VSRDSPDTADRAQYYRDKAAEARATASTAIDVLFRDVNLKLAAEFDKLAEEALKKSS